MNIFSNPKVCFEGKFTKCFHLRRYYGNIKRGHIRTLADKRTLGEELDRIIFCHVLSQLIKKIDSYLKCPQASKCNGILDKGK